MKKAIAFTTLVSICCLFTGGNAQLTLRQPQTPSTRKSVTVSQDDHDKALAGVIRQLTDRSNNGLRTFRSTKGGMVTDLGGRFQNVMLSQVDSSGEPIAACVTSIDEANSFFGKNL